jgi:hypothetical protein
MGLLTGIDWKTRGLTCWNKRTNVKLALVGRQVKFNPAFGVPHPEILGETCGFPPG